MTNRLPKQCCVALFFCLLFSSFQSGAQVFSGEKIQYASPALNNVFYEYEVFRLNTEPLAEFIRSGANDGKTTLQIGTHQWNLNLTSSNLLSENYFTTVQTMNGNVVSYQQPNIAFKGFEAGGGKVRLTVDKGFLYGFIEQGNQTWRIEPLDYLEKGADDDLFVIYEKSRVVPNPAVECGVTEEMERAAKLNLEDLDEHAEARMMAVYELEIAVASDKLMLDKYGSTSAVETHNVSVLNDVEGDYTGNFNHDLCINIVTQFIATSFPGPWSNSNDAGTLLGSFATWGNGGNFGVTFDVGELWTNRDFTGGTVGIAYLNGICNNNKYHCLQDFTSNTEHLRCMTSHELGHNFSAGHDSGCTGGEWIMCPFVSASTSWSGQSSSSINAYMQTKINSGCLASCNQGPPLTSIFEWEPEPGCVNQAVHFTDLSTGTISSWLWTFTGGTPPTSTQQNPTASFSTPGPHNVTLLISSPAGNTAVSNQVVNIAPDPIASFTYTVSNLTLTFTNTSTNATSFFWEFGDGGTSTDQDPVYTYNEAGIYTVTLTASNFCNSISKTYTINTFPTPDFSAEPTSGCATLTVQMTNESSYNATAYQWQFPGGSPAASSQVNPIVLYPTSGNYTVILTAYNISGSNTITKTNYIHVQTVPSSNFNFSVNGLTATFNNTSNNATSYLWNFGDGQTSTETNPVHTYADGGTYFVTLSSTNDCGTVTSTKTVFVSPPPIAAFTTSGNVGCNPFTVSFTNTSAGATSYSWSFPGGDPTQSTDVNPTVLYNTAGTYTVTLTAINLSGTSTATTTITVNTVPSAGFNSTNNGAVVSFDNISTGADSYSWNFGDGGTSTETDPMHTYATDGTYTVTLTATNACGSVTYTQSVTVVTPPTAGFSATPTTGCASLTVQFTNSSSSNATSFNWTFAGGNPSSSTATNPTVVYDNPGTYSVTLIATNSAGNSTLTQTNYITVNTVPAAGFNSSTNGSTATFTNTSTNATSYSWNFGDGNTSTETNPAHSYATDGTYTVVLSATNACGTVTATQTVTIVTPPIAGFNATVTNGCVPFTVQFNNTSSSNATDFSWSFEGGSPATSTDQNPTVVYNTPGVYSVTLTASNTAGSSTATQIDYIQVGTGPNAGFNSSVSQGTATFTNTTVNGNTYSWDFGDGNSSTETDPVHTYASDGTYTVVLTATNTCGTSTFTQNVVIITDTQAGFTASTTSGCAPLTVNFVDLSSENTTSWEWTFPGGTPGTSTEENPTVVYNIPGSYDVTLVATGPGGSSTYTQTGFINVFGPPTADFSPSLNQNTATFNNTSTNATTYLWDFGDNSSSVEQNPVHTYANDGQYTVVLAATNNCGTSFIEQTITIVTVPVAAFTFNNGAGCAPAIVLFNNTSSSNATDFSWQFEGGEPATSTDANPIVTWNTPGTYLVTLTASNSAGSSTATATITVNSAPAAGFTSQQAGLSVIMTNTSVGANSYLWNFGDNSTSTEANPTHTYAATGTYTISLIATNDCGSVTFSQEITISGSAPIPAFTSNLEAGCTGMTVQFTDQSAGAPTGWTWAFEGGTPATSSEQNPSVAYSAPGTYSVSLQVSNAFGTSTILFEPAYIVIADQPVAGFNLTANGGTVSLTNTSTGAGTYLWNFGDGNTSTEANPTHTYTTSGSYTISLTVTNACGASTLEQTVIIVISGTNEASWIDSFKLYPNPSQGLIQVEMSGKPQSSLVFGLYNGLGQLVRTQQMDFNAGVLNTRLDFSDLPAAAYTLRIQSPESAMNIKLIIHR